MDHNQPCNTQSCPIKLEDKIQDLEPRLRKLEENYVKDINRILDLLNKIEKRMIGALEDSGEVGLISEVRDIKKEMSSYKIQLNQIEVSVSEIKSNVTNVSSLVKDIADLKIRTDEHDKKFALYDKYKYIAAGILLAIGWLLNKISPFLEALIK